ncbi:MAG: PspA/IM30 family protein [Cyanobacteriota bacterium]|nr:PspA/IM30 family protein [Cyanobacteriota bacterium]
MNTVLFDRIWRAIRAQINHLVSQREDPEKILEAALAQMQEELFRLRQGVATAIATQKRTERDCTQTRTRSQEWYNRAQLALQKGDEPLAREALARRQTYRETLQALELQLEPQQAIVKQLRENLRALESKIVQVKAKKDLYIARARSAEASQKLTEMLQRNRTDGAIAAFERMEDRVAQLEARSQAISELDADDIERRFASLESGGNVDEQLQALKEKLSGDPPSLPHPEDEA